MKHRQKKQGFDPALPPRLVLPWETLLSHWTVSCVSRGEAKRETKTKTFMLWIIEPYLFLDQDRTSHHEQVGAHESHGKVVLKVMFIWRSCESQLKESLGCDEDY